VASDERRRALALAEEILNRTDIDPDGDITVLARQLGQAQEEIVRLRALLESNESSRSNRSNESNESNA
jgi:hypothetical protein